ncbi:hypothetical protein CALVIDRAFT_257753 [Calocera viscosa TUFC12733]|uniref:Uncharacterized protein n=1 Tax=Calocera viscosa (strain TUFC12733) TaxID=1330018 RepID=A0A167JAZ3_CALVF|nr:hypothetical protein CALVIDRAFT_257753 [Calocera viscosa TUFC12733]
MSAVRFIPRSTRLAGVLLARPLSRTLIAMTHPWLFASAVAITLKQARSGNGECRIEFRDTTASGPIAALLSATGARDIAPRERQAHQLTTVESKPWTSHIRVPAFIDAVAMKGCCIGASMCLIGGFGMWRRPGELDAPVCHRCSSGVQVEVPHSAHQNTRE